MPLGDVQTFYSNNRWHNRIEGTDLVFGTSATRGEAVWAGRSRARSDATMHIVCGVDGQVEQCHSYREGAGGREAARRLTEARAIIRAGYPEPRAEARSATGEARSGPGDGHYRRSAVAPSRRRSPPSGSGEERRIP